MCSSDSLRFLLFLLSFFFFFLMIRLPSSSTLFPYTTLFRSTMDVSSYLGQTLEFSVTNDAGRCRLGVIEINGAPAPKDRKSTRLNSSHVAISYAVFCLKKKKIGILISLLAGLRYTTTYNQTS